MKTCGERVLEALRLQRMTTDELAAALMVNRRTVEQSITRMQAIGLVESAGKLDTGKKGGKPTLWKVRGAEEIVFRPREWLLCINNYGQPCSWSERSMCVRVRELVP